MHTLVYKVLRRIGHPAEGKVFPRDGQTATEPGNPDDIRLAAHAPVVLIDAHDVFGGSEKIAQGMRINGAWFVPADARQGEALNTELVGILESST